MGLMGDKVAELERQLSAVMVRIEELERRPRAGRPGDRIEKAIVWLEDYLRGKRKGDAARFILRKAVKEGFSEGLMRKASIRIGVVKEKGMWSLKA